MSRRLLLVLLAASALLGLLAAPAAASTGAIAHSPIALLGIHFPSIKSIVHGVVGFFFGTLLDALVPSWLRDAALGSLRWLISLPDPTDRSAWPTVGELGDDLRYVGVGLMPLVLTLTATRYWVSGLTGGNQHAGQAVVRVTAAFAQLVAYTWAFHQVVVLVNVLTNTILSFSAVEHGLQRTVGLLFGGAILTGGTVPLAILGIVAVCLAIVLFALKVGLLVLLFVWYVMGWLIISGSPVPELNPFWRLWRFGLLALASIPIGWTVLLALAGAFTLDMTGSNVLSGGLGSKFVGAFATIVVFLLMLWWPFVILGRLRSFLGPGLGFSGAGGGGGGGGGAGRIITPEAAKTARTGLARAAFRGSSAISSLMPNGGLIGLGARFASHASPRVQALASQMPGAQRVATASGVLAPATSALARRAGAIRDRAAAAAAAARGAALEGEAPGAVAAAAMIHAATPRRTASPEVDGRATSARPGALGTPPAPAEPATAEPPAPPAANPASTEQVLGSRSSSEPALAAGSPTAPPAQVRPAGTSEPITAPTASSASPAAGERQREVEPAATSRDEGQPAARSRDGAPSARPVLVPALAPVAPEPAAAAPVPAPVPALDPRSAGAPTSQAPPGARPSPDPTRPASTPTPDAVPPSSPRARRGAAAEAAASPAPPDTASTPTPTSTPTPDDRSSRSSRPVAPSAQASTPEPVTGGRPTPEH